MPIPNLSTANGSSVDELIESLEKQRKQLDWLLQSLDTQNVVELNADIINAGVLNVNQVAIKVDLLGNASITLDSNGLIGYNTAGEVSFKIETDGKATFSGDVTGATISGSLFTATSLDSGTITIGSGEFISELNGFYCQINSGVVEVGTSGLGASGYAAQLTASELFVHNISINEYTQFGADAFSAHIGGGTPRNYNMKANFIFSGSADFSGSTMTGVNADKLGGLTPSSYSLSGHIHSDDQYVKPSSGQAITLGAGATTLNVYLNGSLLGSIPYA
jgi:hypothetical protein